MLDIQQGDCREVMAQMEPGSVDAIVTDPPYGLEFMGQEWDRLGGPVPPGYVETPRLVEHGGLGGYKSRPNYYIAGERAQNWHLSWADEAERVLKPGAHLVAFGGTRTYHRLTCALEDAGLEIRDCLCWLYGSGFPKSLDVSKAIDKAVGAEREVTGTARGHVDSGGVHDDDNYIWKPVYERTDIPATAAAREWSGWGTALKPAWEPVILARKPLVGTVAANVQAHGTGALNVDGCRIATSDRLSFGSREIGDGVKYGRMPKEKQTPGEQNALGRWPANVVLDEEAARMLDEQSGTLTSGEWKGQATGGKGTNHTGNEGAGYFSGKKDRAYFWAGGSGGASRFFYTSKSSSGERHYAGKNTHPTVKPVDLMQWLCRLITPPGGLVLDPFCGSGSTGVAALAEGFRFIGIELDPAYVELARKRIAGPLFASEG